MPARTLRVAGVAASATLLLTALSSVAPAAAAPAAAAPAARQAACAGWAVRPSPSTGAASLSAAAATSDKDVWAVGSSNTGGAFKTLIEHWDGAHWTIVPSPNPAAGVHTTNALGAVVALTPKNAWAFRVLREDDHEFPHPDRALGRRALDDRAEPEQRAR
jgi:hypothetical protein